MAHTIRKVRENVSSHTVEVIRSGGKKISVKMPLPKEVDRFGRPVYRDKDNLPFVIDDLFDFYITDCCDASAKGAEFGIVCRNCYKEVDPALGGIPFENIEGGIG